MKGLVKWTRYNVPPILWVPIIPVLAAVSFVALLVLPLRLLDYLVDKVWSER